MSKNKSKLIISGPIFPKQVGLDGVISVFNTNQISGFFVNRVYTITGERRGSIRGHHAHKQLKQIMFCNYGSIKIQLFDGFKWTNIMLDKPNKFLYVGSMVWRTMEWIEDNSVLTVLATEEYDESDYVRDLNDFNRMVNHK